MSQKENVSYKTYRKTAHPRSYDEGQGWEETEVNDTLNVFDNTENRTPTMILENHPKDAQCVVYENHSQDTRYRPLGDICQTVSATYGMGGNNQPLVVKEVYDGSRRHNYEPFGDVCETVQSYYGTGGGNTPMVTENKSAVVRRLTPIECERLQGFPDNWTDIGEWTDTTGKKHKPADSPRYKALGNSIALPFWEWMACRIVKQLKEDGVEHPTMGSLFDGISGFCLVHKRCGCEPIWSSEIEEFCIAVAKKHFGDDETGEKGDIDEYL